MNTAGQFNKKVLNINYTNSEYAGNFKYFFDYSI